MQCKITLFAVPSKKCGPRTIVFRNVLSFNKIQKCRVRGPLSRPSSPDSSLTLRMTTRGAQNDIPCHHRRSLVTIDGAGGGVKDLKHHSGSLLRLSSQILHSLLLMTQCFPGDQKYFDVRKIIPIFAAHLWESPAMG